MSEDVVTLESMATFVVATRPPDDQPAVCVGAAPGFEHGPSVCVGVQMTLPGEAKGLCLVAHMDTFVALQLADKIRAAALQMAIKASTGGSA